MGSKRIAIVHGSLDDGPGNFVKLSSPNGDKQMTFILRGETLLEVNIFREMHRSWMLEDEVIQDGAMYLCTPIDPLFLALPILDKARQQCADSPGLFCQFEEVIEAAGCEILQKVVSLKQLACLCDEKLVDGEAFFRLNDTKVFIWLEAKSAALLECLLNQERSAIMSMNSNEQSVYAVGMLGEYLTPSWLDRFVQHMGIDMDAVRTGSPASTIQTKSPAPKKLKVEPRAPKTRAPKTRAAERYASKNKSITSFLTKSKR